MYSGVSSALMYSILSIFLIPIALNLLDARPATVNI